MLLCISIFVRFFLNVSIVRVAVFSLCLITSLYSPKSFAECSNPAGIEGKVLYNTSYNIMQYCDGENWRGMGIHNAAAGSGGCSNPTGTEGKVVYNGTYHVFQYCNGEDWVAMAKATPPVDCSLPWGGSIIHGIDVTAYQTSSVAYGASCVFETRSCSDGTLSGTYSNVACAPAAPPTDCTATSETWLSNCTATVAFATHGNEGIATIADPGGCGTTYYGSGTFACSDGLFSYSSGSCVQQTACDPIPDGFSFTDQTDVTISSFITSNSITIAGINTASTISISGAGSPQFRVNGGSWVTSGTITNGQTLELRLTSNAANSTMNSATVTVGGVSDQWDITTVAAPLPGACTLPWGGSINNGESVIAYTGSATATCGRCIPLTRICNNGTLSESGDLQSCSAAGQYCWVHTGSGWSGPDCSFTTGDAMGIDGASCTAGQLSSSCHIQTGSICPGPGPCGSTYYQYQCREGEPTKVLCGYYAKRGLLDQRLYQDDVAYATKFIGKETAHAYHEWALPLIDFIDKRKGSALDSLTNYIVVQWANEMSYRMDGPGKTSVFGRFLIDVIEPQHSKVGALMLDYKNDGILYIVLGVLFSIFLTLGGLCIVALVQLFCLMDRGCKGVIWPSRETGADKSIKADAVKH